jgi:hypothetical protein
MRFDQQRQKLDNENEDENDWGGTTPSFTRPGGKPHGIRRVHDATGSFPNPLYRSRYRARARYRFWGISTQTRTPWPSLICLPERHSSDQQQKTR